MTMLFGWLFPFLPLIGLSLGIFGALYLAYGLSAQQSANLLHKLTWMFSSGFLFASVLLVSYLLLLALEHVTSGYSLLLVWRFAVIMCLAALFMQLIYSPAIPVEAVKVNWPALLLSMTWSGVSSVTMGSILVPPGFHLILGVLSALPAVLLLGLLNGFSASLQWWMLHLPEKRVATFGALLIFCGFVVALVQPLSGLMGIQL